MVGKRYVFAALLLAMLVIGVRQESYSFRYFMYPVEPHMQKGNNHSNPNDDVFLDGQMRCGVSGNYFDSFNMEEHGWSGDCGGGVFGKDWDYDIKNDIEPDDWIEDARFDKWDLGLDNPNDVWPSRTGCYNPEERFVERMHKKHRCLQTIERIVPASSTSGATVDRSFVNRCYPDDNVLVTNPLCIERGEGMKDLYIDPIPARGKGDVRAIHGKNLYLCYDDDYQDDISDFCSDYYQVQIEDRFGNITPKGIDYYVWHAIPMHRSTDDEWKDEEEGDKGYIVENYCDLRPNRCKLTHNRLEINDVARDRFGRILYDWQLKPLEPITTRDHYMPLAIPIPRCGAYGVGGSEFTKDDRYSYDGLKVGYPSEMQYIFERQDVYLKGCTYDEDDGPDGGCPTKRGDDGGRNTATCQKGAGKICGVSLYDAMLPENYGVKLKRKVCLGLYLSEWAHRGDCGEIVLEGAPSNVGEGHCQWVKGYNAAIFPERQIIDIDVGASSDYPMPSYDRFSAAPAPGIVHSLPGDTFNFANYQYARKISEDKIRYQHDIPRFDSDGDLIDDEGVKIKYTLPVGASGSGGGGSSSTGGGSGGSGGSGGGGGDSKAHKWKYAKHSGAIIDEYENNICLRQLVNDPAALSPYTQDGIIDLAKRTCMTPVDLKGFPESWDDPYDINSPMSVNGYFTGSHQYHAAYIDQDPIDGSIHGPPYYRECNPDVGYVRFSRGVEEDYLPEPIEERGGSAHMSPASPAALKPGENGSNFDKRFLARDFAYLRVGISNNGIGIQPNKQCGRPIPDPWQDIGNEDPADDNEDNWIHDLSVWYNFRCRFPIITWWRDHWQDYARWYASITQMDRFSPDNMASSEAWINARSSMYGTSTIGARSAYNNGELFNWNRGKYSYTGFKNYESDETDDISEFGFHWSEFQTPVEPFGTVSYPPRVPTTGMPMHAPAPPNRAMKLDMPMVERIREPCGAFAIAGTWQQKDHSQYLMRFFTGADSKSAIPAHRCMHWNGAFNKVDEASYRKGHGYPLANWRLPRFDYEFLSNFKGCTGPFAMPPTPCSRITFGCRNACMCNQPKYTCKSTESIEHWSWDAENEVWVEVPPCVYWNQVPAPDGSSPGAVWGQVGDIVNPANCVEKTGCLPRSWHWIDGNNVLNDQEDIEEYSEFETSLTMPNTACFDDPSRNCGSQCALENLPDMPGEQHRPQNYCPPNQGFHASWHEGLWIKADPIDDCLAATWEPAYGPNGELLGGGFLLENLLAGDEDHMNESGRTGPMFYHAHYKTKGGKDCDPSSDKADNLCDADDEEGTPAPDCKEVKSYADLIHPCSCDPEYPNLCKTDKTSSCSNFGHDERTRPALKSWNPFESCQPSEYTEIFPVALPNDVFYCNCPKDWNMPDTKLNIDGDFTYSGDPHNSEEDPADMLDITPQCDEYLCNCDQRERELKRDDHPDRDDEEEFHNKVNVYELHKYEMPGCQTMYTPNDEEEIGPVCRLDNLEDDDTSDYNDLKWEEGCNNKSDVEDKGARIVSPSDQHRWGELYETDYIHPFHVWFQCLKFARINACPVIDRDISQSVAPETMLNEESWSTIGEYGGNKKADQEALEEAENNPDPTATPEEQQEAIDRANANLVNRNRDWRQYNADYWDEDHAEVNDRFYSKWNITNDVWMFNNRPIRWSTVEPNILSLLSTERDPGGSIMEGAADDKMHIRNKKSAELVFKTQTKRARPPYMEPVVPYPIPQAALVGGVSTSLKKFALGEEAKRFDYSRGVSSIDDADFGQRELPQGNDAIVGVRGCDIGGWYELMLYQARCIRIFKLNCLCDYDKTFAEGTSEAWVLKRSGIKLVTVKPREEWTDEDDDGFNETKTTTKDIEYVTLVWPRMWRGYASPQYAKQCGRPEARLWIAHRKVGKKYPGLDCAREGDFIIWDEQLRADGANNQPLDARYRRHVAYVEKTGFTTETTENGEQKIPCKVVDNTYFNQWVQVSEWNWGKNQDSCGITDRWKIRTTRTLYRNSGAATATVYNANEPQPINPDEVNPAASIEFDGCNDPDAKSCFYGQNIWGRTKVYRPRWDVRTDAFNNLSAGRGPEPVEAEEYEPPQPKSPTATTNRDCVRRVVRIGGTLQNYRHMTENEYRNWCDLSTGSDFPGCSEKGMPVCKLPETYLNCEELQDRGWYDDECKCILDEDDENAWVCNKDKVLNYYLYDETVDELEARVGLCDPPYDRTAKRFELEDLGNVQGLIETVKSFGDIYPDVMRTTLTPTGAEEGPSDPPGMKGIVLKKAPGGASWIPFDKSLPQTDTGPSAWPDRNN